MYWICLTKEELELAILALENFYNEFYEHGVGNDKEQAEDKAMQDLAEKLEFFKEHDK